MDIIHTMTRGTGGTGTQTTNDGLIDAFTKNENKLDLFLSVLSSCHRDRDFLKQFSLLDTDSKGGYYRLAGIKLRMKSEHKGC